MSYKKILFLFVTASVLFAPPVSSSYAYDIEEGIQAVEVQDLKKAHEIFLKLANEKCVDAMWLLAMMYYKGIGVLEDPKKAFIWFQNAAVLGDPDSINFIGFMYESGVGIDKNLDQARVWYEKAAEKGSVDAMCNLSILQMRMNNNTASYMWYKLAEYYKYEYSDDERKILQNTLFSLLQKKQLMAAKNRVDNWIRNHPDHNELIKKLSETGPTCHSVTIGEDVLATFSHKADPKHTSDSDIE